MLELYGCKGEMREWFNRHACPLDEASGSAHGPPRYLSGELSGES